MIQSGSPASDVREATRAIDTPDFLNRIAEEMRATQRLGPAPFLLHRTGEVAARCRKIA